MNVQFETLFTLRVAHTYYTGTCRDFAVLIPEQTAAAMRSGRLLAREVEGVLHVLYEADELGVPRVPIAGTTLRLGLRLLNPYFGNFTALPAEFPARRLRYTNAADPDTLAQAAGVTFVGDTFTHVLTQAGRPATVTLRDAGGAVLQQDAVTAEDGRTALSYDMRGRPAGPLTVEESFPGNVNASTALYLDPALRDAAAVVEVTIDDDFYGAPPALQIAFEASAAVLSYYVVVDGYTNNEFNGLEVTDEGAGTEDRDPIVFARIASDGFTSTEIPASLLAPGGERVVLFRSQGELARQERGRGRIQLSRQNDVLMANLPQPGVERAKADLIIHLSKP
ncbi:MAG TPA: hypothetical protein VHG93_24620 [Longimicrobium sp.]|nr:hypothetical protein [Longimicrobium sp.]